MKISICNSGFNYPNVRAFLYPFIKFNSYFKENGLICKFTQDLYEECDIIFLESNVFGKKYHEKFNEIESIIKNLRRRVKKIIYFDTSDSTSLLHPKLLPHVDVYCKSQIFSNLKNYKKKYYGNRIFTDFCHKKFKVKDRNVSYSEQVINEKHLKKIKLFWNSGILDHSMMGKIFSQIYYYLPIKFFLDVPKFKKFKKNNDLFFYMTTKYLRNSVSWHRRKALKKLNIDNPHRINFIKYYRYLARSKVCISPFGWGEINYRDFEALIYGSLLLKPNMDHLDTWPNIYKLNSVFIYDWSCNDIKKKLDVILKNYKVFSKYAFSSQLRYEEMITPTKLKKHILKIIKGIIKL